MLNVGRPSRPESLEKWWIALLKIRTRLNVGSYVTPVRSFHHEGSEFSNDRTSGSMISDLDWNSTRSEDSRLYLTHRGRVTHICVSELTNIGSDNGLSPGRRQAIIWTNVGILWIGPLGTNFNEMLIEIHAFSFTKIHLKMSSGNGGHFVSASMC